MNARVRVASTVVEPKVRESVRLSSHATTTDHEKQPVEAQQQRRRACFPELADACFTCAIILAVGRGRWREERRKECQCSPRCQPAQNVIFQPSAGTVTAHLAPAASQASAGPFYLTLSHVARRDNGRAARSDAHRATATEQSGNRYCRRSRRMEDAVKQGPSLRQGEPGS